MLHRFHILAVACLMLASAHAHAQAPAPARPDPGGSLYDLALPGDPAKRARVQAAIEAAIAAPYRPIDHRVRDAGREVRSILAVADVQPGDRVLDLGSGGGYLALLLSALAGDRGHVDVHNTPGWINQFPAMDPGVLKAQLNRPNLGFVTEAWDAIPGPPASYDVIIAGQVYHDAVLEGADIKAMNARLFDLLKPGGRLVIEDHDADPAMPIGQQVGLHRIAVQEVMDQVLAAGFRLRGSLAIVSTHDDKRFNVFRPGVRGRTERFIVAFEKPKG